MMKNKLLLLKISFLIFISASFSFYKICNQDDFFRELQFKTYVDCNLFLHEYLQKIYSSHDKQQRDKYLVLFFRGLPSDFETFLKMSIASPRIGYKLYSHNPWSKFQHIFKEYMLEEAIPREKASSSRLKFFYHNARNYERKNKKRPAYIDLIPYRLGTPIDWDMKILDWLESAIPPKLYYEKLISLGVGGVWDEQTRYLLAGIRQLFKKNLSLSIEILEKYTDDETASFFYFLFDGPFPEDIQYHYHYLYNSLKESNPRIAGLIKKAYEQEELDARDNFKRWEEKQEYE